MVLSKAGASLTVALLLALTADGSAQSPPQPPPAQPQPQAAPAPPSPGARVTQAQLQGTRPRSSRRKKRQSRPSARRPSSAARTEEGRTSRVAGPTSHGLMLTSNFLGGYDDNLTAGLGTGSVSVPMATAGGSAGNLDATLLYRRSNNLRDLVVMLFGDLRAYPGYLKRPTAGGYADAKFMTRVGRNQRLWVSGLARSEPSFSVFSPAVTGAPFPSGIGETTAARELFERRSLTSFTHVETDRRLSGRDWASVSYRYQVTQYPEQGGVDSRMHQVQTQYRRTVTRGVRARGEYRLIDRTLFDRAALSIREHDAEGGADIEKALSRDRYLRVSLSAGGSYIESTGSTARKPYHSWVPSGSASATLGLSPLWSVEGGYRRAFSVLPGVTDEVYATDTAYVTAGGLVALRTDLRVGASYSNWRTPLASGVDDRFDIYGGSLQLGVALTATLSATAGYFYYHHRYSNPAELPAGFPGKYDRHAVRVGLTVSVRLAGTEQTFGGAGTPRR